MVFSHPLIVAVVTKASVSMISQFFGLLELEQSLVGIVVEGWRKVGFEGL